jgi:hypothetical protein
MANRRMTVAELFAFSRMTAQEEEDRARAMHLAGAMRAKEEEVARAQQLARMRSMGQSQIAGGLAQAGVPGGGMMLAQQGISPHVLSMAASMSGAPQMGDF